MGAAMIDLHAEMDDASDACPPRRIIDAGLDWEACMSAGGIGIVRAQTFKDGTYQPVDDGGRLMWLLPAFWGATSPGSLCDLVAWSADDPSRWWRRTGHAAVLGYGNVQVARRAVWDFGGLDSTPPQLAAIQLHPSPKHYALAGFQGAVVLDWRHGLAELDGIGQIYCANHFDFAEELDRQLTAQRPRLPKIMVEDVNRWRAA